jgi:hypothetical protein
MMNLSWCLTNLQDLWFIQLLGMLKALLSMLFSLIVGLLSLALVEYNAQGLSIGWIKIHQA